MLEAMRCIDEGISAETLDAAMLAFGMPMGPIELIDTVGLDIALAAGAQLTDAIQTPRCLAEHIERNNLGKKTGTGFYKWLNGKPVKRAPDSLPEGIAQRLIQPLIDRTRLLLE